MHYLIFADAQTPRGELREVGVYAGAGFLRLSDTPGPTRLSGTLRQGAVRLEDRSVNFNDLLGRSSIEGSFTATRDAKRVHTLLRDITAKATARLGYPRMVDAELRDLPPA